MKIGFRIIKRIIHKVYMHFHVYRICTEHINTKIFFLYFLLGFTLV